MQRAGFSLKEKKNMLISSETRFGIEVTGELHLMYMYVQSFYNSVMYIYIIMLMFPFHLQSGHSLKL